MIKRTGPISYITRKPPRGRFTGIQWIVLAVLAIGALAVGAIAGFALLFRPSAPSSALSTPVSPSGSTAIATGAAQRPTATAPVAQATAGPTPPLPTPSWRPSAVPSDADLKAMVAKMSLEDKVAQMVMVGFHGQSVAASPELTTLVGTFHAGGVVLSEANSHDPRQLSALTAELDSLATSSGARIPLFIAINHEGGIVVRITEGVTGFPGNMAVAATGRSEYAYVSAALAARELRAMGVNMNLAPVLDVNDNPLNPVIGARSFGASPSVVAEYGRLAVRGSQDNGVMAVAKHFPGHGSVMTDSHEQLPTLKASADQMAQRELPPFTSAIKENVAGIMTAHIAVPALDDSGRPATLSPKILTGLLRQRMNYDGLILTDSLGMGAVSTGRGQAQAAVEAVQAGADIVLSTGPMEAQTGIVQTITAAVQRGAIPAERIDRSVLRILRVKYTYGLFGSRTVSDLKQVGSAEYQAAAEEMALRAVTLVRNDSKSIPLPPPPARLLLISPNTLPPAASRQGTLFAELLRARGYPVTELVVNLDAAESRDSVYASALARASAQDVVIFGEWELIKRYMNWGDQWQEELIARLGKSGPPLIVVAWHNPAAILRCSQVSTFLTAYGNTRAQVAAVVAVLTGKQSPTGRLPMTVP